jgi:hypothetical protein
MIPSAVVALLVPVCAPLAAPPAPPPPYGVEWTAPPDMSTIGTEPAGSAALSKTQVTVRTKDTVDYVYTVGAGGMAEGDHLRVEDPWGHGMRWSKWGAPQLDAADCDPLAEETDEASGSLVTVSTSGTATMGIERNTVVHDPHRYAYTDVYVATGALAEGDTVTLRFGDTATNADCGHQFPDRAFQHWAWRAFENIDGAGFTAVTPFPELDVQAETTAALLWVSGPSFVQAGQPFELKVTVLDQLGNPIPGWGRTATLDAAYGGTSQDFDGDNSGWLDFGLRIDDPGVHRVEVTAGSFTVSSNPIVVSADAPAQRLFWGDLHSHHGHTIELEDGSRVDENHVYARDVMGHDLGCESMKMTPIELDDVNLWEELKADCSELSEDGRYLAMLGSEWMGNQSGTSDGHHNVYFDDCTGFLGDHAEISGLEGEGSLLERVRELEISQGTRSVVLPHATTSTGKNWTDYDHELRAGAEVYSEWGDTVDTTVQGNISEALSRGHRFGFYAASDNHDGWLGNPLTVKYELSGLAAFWAPELTRAHVFDALASRRTYATSGARIVVIYELTEGATTVPSGSEIIAEAPRFSWQVYGTAEIDNIELTAVKLEAGARPEQLYQEDPASLDAQGEYSWTGWDGDDYAVFLTVNQDDGELAYATPIWISQDCEGNQYAVDPEGHCVPDTGEETDPPEETGDSTPDSPVDSPPEETGDSTPTDTQDSDTRPPWRDCGCLASGGSSTGGAIVVGLGLLGAAALRRKEDDGA